MTALWRRLGLKQSLFALLVICAVIAAGFVLVPQDSSAAPGHPTRSQVLIRGGNWQVTKGSLRLTKPVAGRLNGANAALLRKRVEGNFRLSVRGSAAATKSPFDDFAVIFGYRNKRNYFAASFNETNDGGTQGLFRVRNGTSRQIANFPGRTRAGKRHTVQVIRVGSAVGIWLDGRRVARVRVATGAASWVGVGARNNRAQFSVVRVTKLKTHRPPPSGRSRYDRVVLADRPAGFWVNASGREVVGGRHAASVGRPGATRLPNGDTAATFNGRQYQQVADNDRWSPSTTGSFTFEAWVRPSRLQFTRGEFNGCYVHWLGKGVPGEHEWVARMYSRKASCESPSRPNRVSVYGYNPAGKLGTGAYFEGRLSKGVPAMKANRWFMVTGVINPKARSRQFPNGYVKIYYNGRLINTRDLASTVPVKLKNRKAPLRFGTRDRQSFFQGAIGKVAIYNRELSAKRIRAHFAAMR